MPLGCRKSGADDRAASAHRAGVLTFGGSGVGGFTVAHSRRCMGSPHIKQAIAAAPHSQGNENERERDEQGGKCAQHAAE